MLSREKFEEIFKEHFHALCLYARRFVLDQDISNDIVQEVFYQLWKIQDEFQPRESMKPYLFSAAYYKCLNHIKHEKLKARSNEVIQRQTLDEFNDFYVNEIFNYQDSKISHCSMPRINQAIEKLPEQCRRIFLLSRKFGLKNREIADFLEISIKVVEKQVAKALSLLRGNLIKNE